MSVANLRILDYNVMVVGLSPGGLMDKVVDSGSTDTGSIPVRDAKLMNTAILRLPVFIFFTHKCLQALVLMCCEKTNTRHYG